MQYLDELPRVMSMGVKGDVIELELEQRIEKLPYLGDDHPVVLLATHGGQVVVVVGRVEEHENIVGRSSVLQAADPWCSIKIRGSSVTFTI